MGKLRKFAGLPFGEQRLFCKAVALLATVRLLVLVLPYPSVRPLLARACRGAALKYSFPPEKYAWSVATAGNVVPGGRHCLSQALALHIFLARRGFESTICYGVQRAATKPLLAHAWIECDGKVLIGGDNLDCFVRLSSPSLSPRSTGPHRDSFF